MKSSSRQSLTRTGQGALAALLIMAVSVAAAMPVPQDEGCGGAAETNSFASAWQSVYPTSMSDDNLTFPASSCQLCHTSSSGGNSFNDYGWDLRFFDQQGLSKTDAILAAESLDSDDDPTGSTNLEEIQANSQPGWTPGPNNTEHFKDGTIQPGVSPPNGIAGNLDPVSPWTDLGGGTPGIAGVPTLTGSGSLVGGTLAGVTLTNAAPSAAMLAWVAFNPVPFPALGGTVHAYPFNSQLLLFSNPGGGFSAATTWPVGLPPGIDVTFQFLVEDLSTIYGITLSNGLRATTP